MSPLNAIGKIFFRSSPLWKRRRNARLLLVSLVVGFLVAAIAIGLMLLTNKPQ